MAVLRGPHYAEEQASPALIASIVTWLCREDPLGEAPPAPPEPTAPIAPIAPVVPVVKVVKVVKVAPPANGKGKGDLTTCPFCAFKRNPPGGLQGLFYSHFRKTHADACDDAGGCEEHGVPRRMSKYLTPAATATTPTATATPSGVHSEERWSELQARRNATATSAAATPATECEPSAGGAGGTEEEEGEASTQHPIRICGLPGCVTAAAQRCTGCGAEWYCSREHQRSHRKAHKHTCSRGNNVKGPHASARLSELRSVDSWIGEAFECWCAAGDALDACTEGGLDPQKVARFVALTRAGMGAATMATATAGRFPALAVREKRTADFEMWTVDEMLEKCTEMLEYAVALNYAVAHNSDSPSTYRDAPEHMQMKAYTDELNRIPRSPMILAYQPWILVGGVVDRGGTPPSVHGGGGSLDLDSLAVWDTAAPWLAEVGAGSEGGDGGGGNDGMRRVFEMLHTVLCPVLLMVVVPDDSVRFS